MSGNSLPRISSPYGSPEPRCQGQFGGSSYCAYGHEFDCMVSGRRIIPSGTQQPIGKWDAPSTANGSACHIACIKHSGCKWWSLESGSLQSAEDSRSERPVSTCLFFDAKPTELGDCQATSDAAPAAVADGGATTQHPQLLTCAYGPEDCGYGIPAHDPFPGPVHPAALPPAACETNSTQCVVKDHGLQVRATLDLVLVENLAIICFCHCSHGC